MKSKMVSMYDEKALCYQVPYFMPTIQAAIRSFGDLCNDKNSYVSKHPADYVLYLVGEYDDETGVTENKIPVQFLCRGSEFKEVKKEVEVIDLGELAKIGNGKKIEVN